MSDGYGSGTPLCDGGSVQDSDDERGARSEYGTDHCDRCYQHHDEQDLECVTTVVNGIEKKERVCPECEPSAREDEKQPLQPDGGVVSESTTVPCGCGEFSITVSDIEPINQFDAVCPECGNHFGWSVDTGTDRTGGGSRE